jgi:hypothetical protein
MIMRKFEHGLIVYKQKLHFLAKNLGIEEFGNETIVRTLVLLLPWKCDQNMCFYSEWILNNH